MSTFNVLNEQDTVKRTSANWVCNLYDNDGKEDKKEMTGLEGIKGYCRGLTGRGMKLKATRLGIFMSRLRNSKDAARIE